MQIGPEISYQIPWQVIAFNLSTETFHFKYCDVTFTKFAESSSAYGQ